MKKIVLLLFMGFCTFGFSQEKKTDFWKQVRFGGGIGLSFGNSTTISVSPSAVYDFNQSFSMGVGATYLYNKFETITSNVYGASLISLYQIPQINVQISEEIEQLFVNQSDGYNRITYNYPALYLGAAYNSGRFAFGFRYDVLYNKDKSVYASPISPIIRFYF